MVYTSLMGRCNDIKCERRTKSQLVEAFYAVCSFRCRGDDDTMVVNSCPLVISIDIEYSECKLNDRAAAVAWYRMP